MTHKYIALDIGNVCLKLNIPAALNAFGLSELPHHLLAVIDAYERGKINDAQMCDAVREIIPHSTLTNDEIKSNWNLIIGDEVEGMADLVHHGIQMGYRFVFFSDTNPSHFLNAIEKISFAHLVDGRVVSYETGHKKPEEEMFEAFERYYGAPAFYIDDRPENVSEAQKQHGWSGVVFTTASHALDALKKYHQTHSHAIQEYDDFA